MANGWFCMDFRVLDRWCLVGFVSDKDSRNTGTIMIPPSCNLLTKKMFESVAFTNSASFSGKSGVFETDFKDFLERESNVAGGYSLWHFGPVYMKDDGWEVTIKPIIPAGSSYIGELLTNFAIKKLAKTFAPDYLSLYAKFLVTRKMENIGELVKVLNDQAVEL